MSMSNTNAFWISPTGKIIEVDDTHIDMVNRNPEMFGLTQDDLADAREKHGMIYDGSKARDFLMTNLMQDGWVRIRKVNKGFQHWTIQIFANRRIPSKAQKNIMNWAEKMIKAKKSLGEDNVIVIDHKGEILFGGATESTWKTIKNVWLDDSGVFENTAVWSTYRRKFIEGI